MMSLDSLMGCIATEAQEAAMESEIESRHLGSAVRRLERLLPGADVCRIRETREALAGAFAIPAREAFAILDDAGKEAAQACRGLDGTLRTLAACKARRPRASKGWRRHVRRVKAEGRSGKH